MSMFETSLLHEPLPSALLELVDLYARLYYAQRMAEVHHLPDLTEKYKQRAAEVRAAIEAHLSSLPLTKQIVEEVQMDDPLGAIKEALASPSRFHSGPCACAGYNQIGASCTYSDGVPICKIENATDYTQKLMKFYDIPDSLEQLVRKKAEHIEKLQEKLRASRPYASEY